MRTKPYEKRIEGVRARSNFEYNPFNFDASEELMSGGFSGLSRVCSEVTHISPVLQKSVEYLKIDASSLGAISMSMNQTHSGQEKVFVILKCALRKICDFRSVNLATTFEKEEIQIREG